jgi:phosphatidylserine/phosphatidylglycerophosphate/cardiolipin synthase-like enzyme
VDYFGAPDLMDLFGNSKKLLPWATDEARKNVGLAEQNPIQPNFQPAKARFINNRPRFQETYIRQAYVDQLDHAQTSAVLVNAYFVPPPQIVEAIKRAVLRGVKLTIITNSRETNDLPQMADVSRSFYKTLYSFNHDPSKKPSGHLDIYEWTGFDLNNKNAPHDGTIHAKFAVFDSLRAIVGSYNLDPRSDSLNSETVMLFENGNLASTLQNYVIGSDTTPPTDLKKCRLISEDQANKYYDPQKTWDKLNLHFNRKLRNLM